MNWHRVIVPVMGLLSILAACRDETHPPMSEPAVGGSGGGGTGGTSNTGGAGGAGGTGGGTGGTGGEAGTNGDLGWLDEDSVWRDLPASSEEAEVRVRESVPGTLRFPPLGWTECGQGCEFVELTTGDELWAAAIENVTTADGPRVVASFLQPRPAYWFRRHVDLLSGETTMALRMDSTATNPDPSSPPHAGKIGESAYLTTIYSNGLMLRAVYDGRAASWEFKFPWAETEGNTCDKWAADSSPPAIFFGCENVSVLASPGSNELTAIPAIAMYGAGAAGPGISVWSEIAAGTPPTSWIRAWSGGAAARNIVGPMPGAACGVAASTDRIVGVRSSEGSSTDCYDQIGAPEFWSVSRDGGAVASWKFPDVTEASVSRVVTWGDFAAARTVSGSTDLPQAERSHIWLIRLSDGRMRRFAPTPGFEWRGSLLALDDTFLYVGENRAEHRSSFNKIIRYHIEDFDEIGSVVE